MTTIATQFVARPGTALPNGALVLTAKLTTPDCWTVLALRSDAYNFFESHEYVTWRVSAEDGFAFWGHYHHDDFDAAVADYQERR